MGGLLVQVPFVEPSAKAELASSIETQPGVHLATLSAFRIIDVPIMAARNKDVRCKRVVFGFHCASSDSTSSIAVVSRFSAS